MTPMTNLNYLLAEGQPPNAWIWAMAIGFTAICLIMMLVVLIQKPKGGGLSGAFGGGAGGGSESAFIGGRVGDVLTWTTVVCFILFLLLAMGMTWGIKGGGPTEDPEQTDPATQTDGDTTDQDADNGTGDGAGPGNGTDTPPQPPAEPDAPTAPGINIPPDTNPQDGETDLPDADNPEDDTTDTPAPDEEPAPDADNDTQ